MKKILLIEDAPQVAGILLAKLEREGHSLRWVRSRRQALAALADPYDLILLSTYLLPERNAWELLADLQNGTTPVVFLLEHEEAHLKARAHAAGAVAIIQKPFKPTLVAKQIHQLLGTKSPTTASPAQDKPRTKLPPLVAGGNGDNGCRLLLVDRCEQTRMVLTPFLNEQGYAFTYAADTQAALTALWETRFEVILVDTTDAELEGEAFLKTLRANDPDDQQVRIAFYPQEDPQQEERLLAAGATACLTKPLDFHEMTVVLDRFARPKRTLSLVKPG